MVVRGPALSGPLGPGAGSPTGRSAAAAISPGRCRRRRRSYQSDRYDCPTARARAAA